MMGSVLEKSVDLVWNKGIARLCDRRIPDEFPDGLTYVPVPTFAGADISSRLPADLIADPVRYKDIREGELVWVRLSWLPSFVQQVLPLVRANFVLVTGDSDSSVPSELGAEARILLACDYVIRWYAQNYDGSACNRKISPLPIGIDFHTLAERPFWGEGVTAPSRQEEILTAIGGGLLPVGDRAPRVYLDFGSQDGDPPSRLAGARLFEGRAVIARKLSDKGVAFCQGAPLPRTVMWRSRSRFAAVLSPHGHGLDCHRTWESLALGHLVLVPSSSLDPLFTGLAVIPVENWDDVTSENLRRWVSAQKPETRVPDKLTSRFWIEQMRSAASGE
jgi:hypothetical protein